MVKGVFVQEYRQRENGNPSLQIRIAKKIGKRRN